VGRGLIDIFKPWGFPLSSCETAEYEVIGCLDDSQSPALLVTTLMEVLSLPAMSVRIINSHESSLRILVPYKFHDHLPMGGGPKGLRVSEIFFRIISGWNTRLRFHYQLFLGISKICFSLGKLLLHLLKLLV
jgi:hypothetical protein